MIKIKTYSEFLDGRERSLDAKREYIKYLQGITREINDRINREQTRMSPSELKAIETISNYFEQMAEKE